MAGTVSNQDGWRFSLEFPVRTPWYRWDLRIWRYFFPPKPKAYNFELGDPKSMLWYMD